MSKTVVISQPMFIPWIGLFEQIRMADVYIHYDDVQFPQGRSFMSRVQIKTTNGTSWLTAPIDRKKSGRLINEVVFSKREDWRTKHLKVIRQAYSKAPHFDAMFDLVETVYSFPSDQLSEFNIHAIEQILDWIGYAPRLLRSSSSGVGGSSTQRLVDLCNLVDADTYVTGLGALNYLEHEKFEENGISVRYMDYKKKSYVQQYGEFTPYVSIIDAIANCGDQVRDLICSQSIYWRDYVNKRK